MFFYPWGYMQSSAPDSFPPDSTVVLGGYARRLAFEPEMHTDFIFRVVGPDGRDVTGVFVLTLGLLAGSVVVGVWLWRRQHRHKGP
jgi:hypothetical protein